MAEPEDDLALAPVAALAVVVLLLMGMALLHKPQPQPEAARLCAVQKPFRLHGDNFVDPEGWPMDLYYPCKFQNLEQDV